MAAPARAGVGAGAGSAALQGSSRSSSSTRLSSSFGAGDSLQGMVKSCKEVTYQRSLELDLVRFTWNLDNFSWYRDSRGQSFDVLESPHFQTDDGQYDWVLRLIIHPRPDRPADELCRDSVQIFLHLHAAPRETVSLKCQFIFVRLLAGKEDHTYQITRSREFRRGETWGFRRFIQRSTLFEAKNGFLQGQDRLTVRINLDIVRGIRDDLRRTIKPIVQARDDLRADFQQLLESAPHSDVVFEVADGSEVPAHKGLLAARSPVFRAMLAHDMSELRTNRIPVEDIPRDVLQTFLTLLYTGQAPNDQLEEQAGFILALSERYQIPDLKEKALEALRAKMSVQNAADLLSLSDLHNAPELKNEVMEFILENLDEVRKTDAFQEEIKNNSQLLVQLLDMEHERNKSPYKRQRTDGLTSPTGET